MSAEGRRLFFSSRSSDTKEWVEVVSAHPARDIEELFAIINKAYRAPRSSGEAGWTSEADLISGDRVHLSTLATDLLRPAIEQTTLTLFLCSLDGDAVLKQLAGTLQVTSQPGKIAEFGRFAVRTDLQSRGFGGTLLNVAERVAVEDYKASHAQIFVLDCRPELVEVYRRRGFVHVPGYSVDLKQRLSVFEAASPNASLILEMYRKPLLDTSQQ